MSYLSVTLKPNTKYICTKQIGGFKLNYVYESDRLGYMYDTCNNSAQFYLPESGNIHEYFTEFYLQDYVKPLVQDIQEMNISELISVTYGEPGFFSSVDVKEMVNHPDHYKGNKFEVIEIIEDYNLSFSMGNAVKYLLRAGKKDNTIQDLKKAVWYIEREIKTLENKNV